MALVHTTKLIGVRPPLRDAVPAILLASLAIVADVPEFVFLVAIFACLMVSEMRAAAIKWWTAFAQHSASVTFANVMSSSSPLIVLGALLSCCVLRGQLRLTAGLATLFAYLVQKRYNTARKLSGCETPTDPVARATSGRSARGLGQWQASGQRRLRASDKPLGAQLSGLDDEVQHVVVCGTPTSADHAAMRRLQTIAQKSISPVVPEAEFACIPHGNLQATAAAGERPEISLIVTVDRSTLQERLREYFLQGQGRLRKSLDSLQADTLLKTAIKVLAERLTFVKYWRSQYTGLEPMVVLLVPDGIGFFNFPLKMNFFVNNPYPMRLNKLLSAQHPYSKQLCKLFAKEATTSQTLMMLVLRWARQRCITNIARGHPHVYAWALLVVHFVRYEADQKDFGETKVIEFLKEFMKFYCMRLGCSDQYLCVTFSGVTSLRPESVALGIPYIEDPYDPDHDLSQSMTADGLVRVKTELDRAVQILAHDSGGHLARLFERWLPPPADT